jgi:hypothetical protein
MPTHKPENDVIILHDETIDLASNTGRELTADCTRAAENLISDDDLRAKRELSPSDLESLTRCKAVKAFRNERERRVRSGLAAREAAAGYFVKAPQILLNLIAGGEAGTPNVGPNFLIRIDLTVSGAPRPNAQPEMRAAISPGAPRVLACFLRATLSLDPIRGCATNGSRRGIKSEI